MNRSRSLGAVLATVALTAGALVGSASTASAVYVEPQPSFHLKSAYGGKCVALQGVQNGTNPFGWDCLDFADQFWTLDDTNALTPGVFQLKNVNSGKCLIVRGFENAKLPEQYECLNFADQFWQKVSTENPDVFKLKNFNSGKCLAMQGFDVGRHPFQYDCEDYADQGWYIR
ncbi:RICIN domain-containing protein [Streptomyces sp. NPDC094032]|uniref:RICIN domain-containing protein n=1 Tax=Streptomyces sp. NPDC094032 TaxID=3155308 RepID=UPI003322388C